MKFMKVHLIEVLKPQSLNKRFTVPLQLVLGLVLFFGVSNIESKVESTFRDLQHKITSQLSALGVSRGDVILLDPVSVDSQGWREYRFVNIWMDSYVPYDMESISKYRDRWLQFCGDKPMETCQYLTNQLNDKDFEAFLKTNNIDVIVRGTSSPKLLPHNWSRSAVSGSYEAFRK